MEALPAERDSGGQAKASAVDSTGMLPGWLNVKDFGAKGDLQAVTDGVMTNGSAVLTSAAGRFKPAEAGKLCTVNKAASGAASLSTTIVSWQSANQVTLRDPAGIAVANAGAIWGTDGTKAIQAATDDVDARDGGTIHLPPGTYHVHGPLGGARGENAQLRLPSLDGNVAESAGKRFVPISFVGASVPVRAGWLRNLADNHGGSLLFSDSQSDGQGAMIGVKGPTSINPAQKWPFLSNPSPHFENLAFLVTDFRTIKNGAPFGPSITALDSFNAQAASTRNVDILHQAPNFHNVVNPWCGSTPPTSCPKAAGIRFPQVLNNTFCTAEGDLSVIGFPTGVVVSELFCGFRVGVFGCHTGLFVGPSSHSLVIQNVVSQWNHFGIAVTEAGNAPPRIMISSYSVEVDNPGDAGWAGTPAWTGNGDDYHDPKDIGRGLIYYASWNKGYADLRITRGGNPKVKIVNLGK